MNARRKRAFKVSLARTESEVVYSTEIKSEIPDRTAQNAPHSETSTVVVDNPFRGQMDPETGTIERAHSYVTRSHRDDLLAAMEARGQISECEYLAGRKWEALAERSRLGGARAIDTTREVVDVSPSFSIISDDQIRASWFLEAAAVPLGEEGNTLVTDLLWWRLSLRAAAEKRGHGGERGVNYTGRRFVECLKTLSVHFGFETPLTTCQAKRYG
jgi:hypothetical protein